ncbi:hypothetical protein ACW68H_08865 [Vibrio diabolicus]
MDNEKKEAYCVMLLFLISSVCLISLGVIIGGVYSSNVKSWSNFSGSDIIQIALILITISIFFGNVFHNKSMASKNLRISKVELVYLNVLELKNVTNELIRLNDNYREEYNEQIGQNLNKMNDILNSLRMVFSLHFNKEQDMFNVGYHFLLQEKLQENMGTRSRTKFLYSKDADDACEKILKVFEKKIKSLT